jgi:hypothetical protein
MTSLSPNSDGGPQWMSFDPKLHHWVLYSATNNAEIEAAYRGHRAYVHVLVNTVPFLVDFGSMYQINSRKGRREVRRDTPTEPTTPLGQETVGGAATRTHYSNLYSSSNSGSFGGPTRSTPSGSGGGRVISGGGGSRTTSGSNGGGADPATAPLSALILTLEANVANNEQRIQLNLQNEAKKYF